MSEERTENATWRLETPRELLADERELLDFLIATDFPGALELRVQAEVVKVRSGCNCGCRSVDLWVPEDKVPLAMVTQRVPVSGHDWRDPNRHVEALLHVIGGYLSELEVVEYVEASSGVMPDPAHLEIFATPDDGSWQHDPKHGWMSIPAERGAP